MILLIKFFFIKFLFLVQRMVKYELSILNLKNNWSFEKWDTKFFLKARNI
jgi:hypothetical protein